MSIKRALTLIVLLVAWSGVSFGAPRGSVRSHEENQLTIHIPEIGLVAVSLAAKGSLDVPSNEISDTGSQQRIVRLNLFNASLRARRVEGQHSIYIEAVSSFMRGKRKILFVPFTVETVKRTTARKISYELFLIRNGSGYLFDRLRRRSLRSTLRCPLEPLQAQVAPRNESAPPLGTRAATMFLGMEVEVDSRFYSIYQADSAAIVATVLQRVNTIYTDQLGIELRLAKQSIYSTRGSDPYAKAIKSSGALLNLLQSVRGNSDADIVHLFTSARGYLDAIGLAYIGVVCALSDFKFGWSDYASGFSVFVQTVAHEIGHNFNATHDSTDTHGIMSVSQQVNTNNPHFSSYSLAEMNGFLATNSSCLNNSNDPALPTPSAVSYPSANERHANIRVSIRKSTHNGHRKISGNIQSIVTGLLSKRVVELRRLRDSKLLDSTLSNSRGNYEFSLRNKGSYYTVESDEPANVAGVGEVLRIAPLSLERELELFLTLFRLQLLFLLPIPKVSLTSYVPT